MSYSELFADDYQEPVEETLAEDEMPTIEDFDKLMTQFAQDSYALTKGYNNYDISLIQAATENLASYAELLDYFSHTIDFEPAKREKEARSEASEQGQIYVPKKHIELI